VPDRLLHHSTVASIQGGRLAASLQKRRPMAASSRIAANEASIRYADWRVVDGGG
jgi:hypothetical protein